MKLANNHGNHGDTATIHTNMLWKYYVHAINTCVYYIYGIYIVYIYSIYMQYDICTYVHVYNFCTMCI